MTLFLAQRDFVDHFTRIDSIGKKKKNSKYLKIVDKDGAWQPAIDYRKAGFENSKELTFSWAKAQKMQTDVDEIAVPQGKGDKNEVKNTG